MASIVYNKAKQMLMSGQINLTSTTSLKVLLLESTSSTPDNPDHDTLSDFIADEFSDTNYTGGHAGSGRKAVSSVTVVLDNTNDRAYYDLADITWTALGGTSAVVGVCLFMEMAADTSSVPIVFADTADVTTNGGDFTLQFDSSGFIRLS